jgi:uncharacterized protein (TIGR02646 family)
LIQIARTRTGRGLDGFTGVQLQAKLEKLLQYYYDDGANGKVDFKPKKRQVWGKAKPQLKTESFSKCAYCEADTAVVAYGDVEHFRPKSEYWWLAYCYDNYTFSCQVCNQVHKGDKFTVNGTRLPAPQVPHSLPTDSAQLESLLASLCPDPVITTDVAIGQIYSAEDADLINPYVVNPEEYYAWKAIPATEEVWLVPKTKSQRSVRAVKAAEEILGLNREELLRLRWNAYDEIETLALAIQEGTFTDEQKRDLLIRIKRAAGNDRPFAGMKRFFLRAWGVLT